MQRQGRQLGSRLPVSGVKRPHRSKSLQARITFNDTVQYDTNNNDNSSDKLGGSLRPYKTDQVCTRVCRCVMQLYYSMYTSLVAEFTYELI